MLKVRVIPCLDIKDGVVVKGNQFKNLVETGNPVDHAMFYNDSGADELCFLDINASHENRGIICQTVSEVAKKCFIPLTVGGGIATLDDIKALFNAGADKISINSLAVRNPHIIEEAARIFGSQAVVVAIDVKKNSATGVYEVYTHGGRNNTFKNAIEWAEFVTNIGAGEILLTSMDCDGTKDGFDNEINSLITEKVTIPVIASGGAGELDHFVDAVKLGGVSAVLAASVFHFGKFSVKQVKQYLAQNNIAMRL